MYLEDTIGKDSRTAKIHVKCDDCGREEYKQFRGCELQLRKYGKHLCRKCSFKPDNRGGHVQGRVLARCSQCGREREIVEHSYQKNLKNHGGKYVCRPCTWSGREHLEETKQKLRAAALGKVMSEETKRKIRETWAKKEWTEEELQQRRDAAKRSSRFRGRKHTKETKAKMSAAKKGKIFTDEHRQHISEGRKKMLDGQGGLLPETVEKIRDHQLERIRSGKQASSYDSGYVETRWGRFYCRSSYEKRFLALLESMDPGPSVVLSGEDRVVEEELGLVIWYKDPETGREHRYLPDFVVDRRVVELKPEKLVSHPVNLAKMEAAEVWCKENGYEYEVWTEESL